jgi:hypothetical protein
VSWGELRKVLELMWDTEKDKTAVDIKNNDGKKKKSA